MAAREARCERCGLTYDVGSHDVPITADPYTCDDCGGYVDVVDDTRVDLGAVIDRLSELLDDEEPDG